MQTISPARTLKLTPRTGIVLVDLARHDEVLDLQNRLADLAGLLIDGKLHVAANHHLGQFLFRGVLDVNGAIYLPLRRTEQRSETAMISLSLW